VRPFPGASGYVASKAAVIAFSAALAVEYGRDGVRSNVVLPTMIDTPANRADQPGADGSRWTPPDRIAEVIHFLASAGASSVNGAAIPV
jgi:NAD(P)-dependent dehydrogenase (short-subunit alcohol dehydrogenase family)